MYRRAHVPAVHMHTEALAGRGETCRWMSLSAAAGASGDRVLAIQYERYLTGHADGQYTSGERRVK